MALRLNKWRFSHRTLLVLIGQSASIITVGMSYGHKILEEDWFTMLQ